MGQNEGNTLLKRSSSRYQWHVIAHYVPVLYGAKALGKHQLAVLVFVTRIVRLALTIHKTPDSAAAHTGFSARECKCCS